MTNAVTFLYSKCKKCGEYDAMSNSMNVGGWTGSPASQAKAKQAPIHEDIERKVFLQEKIKEDKERIKKEIMFSVLCKYTSFFNIFFFNSCGSSISAKFF